MFRRFMIVCWVLFLFAASIGTVSFYGLSKDWEAHRADLIIELGPPDPQTCDRQRDFESLNVLSKARCEIHIQKIEQARLKHIGDYRFGQTAYYARALAIGILLWNLIWHTGHWIWMGRKEQ